MRPFYLLMIVGVLMTVTKWSEWGFVPLLLAFGVGYPVHKLFSPLYKKVEGDEVKKRG